MRLILCLAFLLAACGSTSTITRWKPQIEYKVIYQPCVSGRPDKVTPLKDKIPDAEWNKTVTLKDGTVVPDTIYRQLLINRQADERMTYAEHLDAATHACPSADAVIAGAVHVSDKGN